MTRWWFGNVTINTYVINTPAIPEAHWENERKDWAVMLVCALWAAYAGKTRLRMYG